HMGAGTTICIQAVEESIPGIGQIVGGVFAAKAIAGGAMTKDFTAMSHVGEGRSGYEEAANDIEAACAVLDAASNLINVLGGLAGAAAGGLGRGGAHHEEETPPPPADEPRPAPRTASGELTIEAEPTPGRAPVDEVWPEEYNVPSPPEEPLHIELTPERADAMLDLAESGDVRGFHTDQELFDAHQDALARRQPGPDRGPRAEFNKLRNRMD